MTVRKSLPFRNNLGMGAVGAILLAIVALIIAAGVGALLGYYTGGFEVGVNIREVFEPPFGGKSSVNILVLGEDDTGIRKSTRGLSDTIMLVHIDLEAKRVAALSIPRDTRVDLAGYRGITKINATHVHGGPALTALAVQRLVGIKPDYYIATNSKGFAKCVDILGGVEIDVEKNMRYTDNWGGLYINLKKGLQVLDGDKAMQYVRFRHDAMGDISRIERQQKFLKALAEKARSPAKLPKLPKLAGAILENVETDLNPKDAVYLARFVGQIDMDTVEMGTLPGIPRDISGISYWIPERNQSAKFVQDLFYPRPALPRVEVLNGSGVNGAAQKVADLLKQYGYEITAVRNADSFNYDSSQVIGHGSDVRSAEQLARIVRSSNVRHDPDSSAEADITLIVGKDYELIVPGS